MNLIENGKFYPCACLRCPGDQIMVEKILDVQQEPVAVAAVAAVAAIAAEANQNIRAAEI
jgi:hypothetical protein